MEKNQEAYVLSSEVPAHFPDANFCARTTDKRITQDSSRTLEAVARSRPILFVPHVILQNRDDVLTTAYKPFSVCEVECFLIAGVHSISDPRAQKSLIEPYGVAECAASLHVEREPSFAPGRREVRTPKNIAGMVSIIASIENARRARLRGVYGGGVISRGPERVNISRIDFWK